MKQIKIITILFLLIPLITHAEGEKNIKPITINKDSHEFKYIKQIITDDVTDFSITNEVLPNKIEGTSPNTIELHPEELPPMENTPPIEKPINMNELYTSTPSIDSLYIVERTNELAIFALPTTEEIQGIQKETPLIMEKQINTNIAFEKVCGKIDISGIETKSLTTNLYLNNGDDIHVGDIIEGNNTQIRMADNTIIYLSPKSKIKIVKYNINPLDKESSIINLLQGTIRVISGYQPTINPFRFAIVTADHIFTSDKSASDFWIQSPTTENKITYTKILNNSILSSPRDIKNKASSIKLLKNTYKITAANKALILNKPQLAQTNIEQDSFYIDYTQHKEESLDIKQKYKELFTN